MPRPERWNPILKGELIRASLGILIMFLGTGVTLGGWAFSVNMMKADPSVAQSGISSQFGRLPIILIPVFIGWAVYFVGCYAAGKSWSGRAACVGMGIIVFLVGIVMYVMGFTTDGRDPVLFLFWGTWVVALGIASVAFGVRTR